MSLSQTTATVLIDMIENRLAVLQIGSREELREVMTLQKCLSEIQGIASAAPAGDAIPTRGRRRKLSALLEDFAVQPAAAPRKQA